MVKFLTFKLSSLVWTKTAGVKDFLRPQSGPNDQNVVQIKLKHGSVSIEKHLFLDGSDIRISYTLNNLNKGK